MKIKYGKGFEFENEPPSEYICNQRSARREKLLRLLLRKHRFLDSIIEVFLCYNLLFLIRVAYLSGLSSLLMFKTKRIYTSIGSIVKNRHVLLFSAV